MTRVVKNANAVQFFRSPEFILCSRTRKTKPPFLKELYVRSSLATCDVLEEPPEQQTVLIKVEHSSSEDNTYRVG